MNRSAEALDNNQSNRSAALHNNVMAVARIAIPILLAIVVGGLILMALGKNPIDYLTSHVTSRFRRRVSTVPVKLEQ